MLRERWRGAYLLKERNLREATVVAYDWGLGHLERWLDLDAEAISASDVRKYLAESPDSLRTKHLVLSSVKSFHRFHCLEADVPMNGIAALAGPRLPVEEGRALTRTEADTLLGAIKNPREARLVQLGLLAGTRISEALERVGDNLGITRWASDRLHIFGKGAKPRQVPLHRMIDVALIQRDDSRSRSQLRWAGYKIAMRTGIEFVPHDLRRTFAHWLEEGDVPTYRIKKLLGHAGDVTVGYTGTSWEKLVGDVRGVPPWIETEMRGATAIIRVNR